jgi:hypothetical protein
MKGAAAAAGVAAVAPGRAAVSAVTAPSTAPSERSAPSDFDVVVYNGWFPPAKAFAADLARRGALSLAVQGDAGKLWYDTLREVVAGGSRRIAGMTTHTDLLILETLARDQGLKVRRRNSVGGARLVSWVLI